MAHERSETVKRNGKWINVYGKGTPKAGQRLPNSKEYNTVDAAVKAAKARSKAAGKTKKRKSNGKGR